MARNEQQQPIEQQQQQEADEDVSEDAQEDAQEDGQEDLSEAAQLVYAASSGVKYGVLLALFKSGAGPSITLEAAAAAARVPPSVLLPILQRDKVFVLAQQEGGGYSVTFDAGRLRTLAFSTHQAIVGPVANLLLHQPTPAVGYVRSVYPVRPGVPDCYHWVAKNQCRHKQACVFNHSEILPAQDTRPQKGKKGKAARLANRVARREAAAAALKAIQAFGRKCRRYASAAAASSIQPTSTTTTSSSSSSSSANTHTSSATTTGVNAAAATSSSSSSANTHTSSAAMTGVNAAAAATSSSSSSSSSRSLQGATTASGGPSAAVAGQHILHPHLQRSLEQPQPAAEAAAVAEAAWPEYDGEGASNPIFYSAYYQGDYTWQEVSYDQCSAPHAGGGQAGYGNSSSSSNTSGYGTYSAAGPSYSSTTTNSMQLWDSAAGASSSSAHSSVDAWNAIASARRQRPFALPILPPEIAHKRKNAEATAPPARPPPHQQPLAASSEASSVAAAVAAAAAGGSSSSSSAQAGSSKQQQPWRHLGCNEAGLPMFAGAPTCVQYMGSGRCHAGSSCCHHHPLEVVLPECVVEGYLPCPFFPGQPVPYARLVSALHRLWDYESCVEAQLKIWLAHHLLAAANPGCSMFSASAGQPALEQESASTSGAAQPPPQADMYTCTLEEADAVLQQLWADAPDASNTTSSSSGSSTTTDATTVTAIMPYSGCMRDLLAADPYLQLIGGDGAGGDCGGNSACVDSVEQGGAAVRISVRLSLQAIKARIDF